MDSVAYRENRLMGPKANLFSKVVLGSALSRLLRNGQLTTLTRKRQVRNCADNVDMFHWESLASVYYLSAYLNLPCLLTHFETLN